MLSGVHPGEALPGHFLLPMLPPLWPSAAGDRSQQVNGGVPLGGRSPQVFESCVFRARQRDKIALLLEEFSTVQEEADR